MLAANLQMSNRFLHSGQNLEFVRKTDVPRCKNLWNIHPITPFPYMTKRNDFFGLFHLASYVLARTFTAKVL